MKKIIHSVVVALILSVILVLIFPTWLLQKDARWTYLNDTAFVDISFVGNLKKGRAKVAGTDLKATQPKSLSTNDFQGTVVELPISYRVKTYQVKITPQADEWGQDTALLIKFRGKDSQHKGERKPAWVSFRNIILNRQHVTTEKVVCHDQPFLLKYPLLPQEITLAFDVCKPLATSEIDFARVFIIFFAFLLFCLFFTPLKRAANKALTFTNRWDIVQILSDGYRHIDPVCRRSFWIVFGVLCFAFGFHALQYMWGNHDWPLLRQNQHLFARAFQGRYMIYSIKVLISDGVYLPLIYDLITFITLALNAVLLCKYWQLEKRVTYFVLCGLVLTVQPFTLSMLYYAHMIPEVFLGVTCVLASLLLSEKIGVMEISLIKKIVYSFIAIVLVTLALATYQVLINTIAVAFVGRMLIQSFAWDGSWQQMKTCIKPFLFSVILTILGTALYRLIITFFPIRSYYNTDTLPLHLVPERLVLLLKQCFHQLYEYNYPFITRWILWIFLGFTIILALYICCSVGSIRQKIIRLSCLFGSLFATQATMLVAKTHLIDGRVELFGLVFFETLVTVVVMTRFQRLLNISVIAGACIVLASIINDLDCLRVWKLGFDAEKMLWNRILTRLEIQPEFCPNKKYRIIQIGNPISLRKRYYTGHITSYHDHADNILGFSYDAFWRVFYAPESYYPTHFRNTKFRYSSQRMDFAQLKRLYQAGVLQKAEVWPKPNGLIVWKDIILFVTDGKELEKYKKRFEREFGER